jgi:curved DNA-binding protein
MREYFAILGLEPGATPREIRLAFRRLARELHPDLASAHGLGKEEAESRFREVRQAYEVLLAAPAIPGRPAAATSAPARTKDGAWRRATPFEKRPDKGADFELGLAVTLEEVLLGGVRQVSYRLVPHEPHRQAQAIIPRGVRPDQVLRVPKEGHPGRHGGRPGDLLLRVRYAPHAWFSVEGVNLGAELAVHPALAVVGGVFPIPLLGGGEHALQVPAGVQATQQYRIHGQGLPQAGPGQSRGDLVVTISIAIPTAYSMEERRLWEQLARLAVQGSG